MGKNIHGNGFGLCVPKITHTCSLSVLYTYLSNAFTPRAYFLCHINTLTIFHLVVHVYTKKTNPNPEKEVTCKRVLFCSYHDHLGPHCPKKTPGRPPQSPAILFGENTPDQLSPSYIIGIFLHWGQVYITREIHSISPICPKHTLNTTTLHNISGKEDPPYNNNELLQNTGIVCSLLICDICQIESCHYSCIFMEIQNMNMRCKKLLEISFVISLLTKHKLTHEF